MRTGFGARPTSSTKWPRNSNLILLIVRRVNGADHELDHPQIRRQYNALPCVFFRFELVVRRRVDHATNHLVVVQLPKESLRVLVLAHLPRRRFSRSESCCLVSNVTVRGEGSGG